MTAAPHFPTRVWQVVQAMEQSPPKLRGVPMQYLPTAKLQCSKFPDVIQGLKPEDCSFDGKDNHHARVVCSLCYLAFDGVDEAHNLVTPLSWGGYTEFSGPPVSSSAAAPEARYVHALVHRREGSNPGEFGTGWNNSGYWTSQTGTHPVMDPLRDIALSIAKGNASLEEHMEGHTPQWNPKQFLGLCSKAAESDDALVRSFCEQVQFHEWKLLVEFCLSEMQGQQ
mmetsp:Transcript_19778/g.54941  ORF Transcript_19778/g.54941 Transcript_19778/m.54941 type:complete len:225 (+) Transcript_19778:101-775(+)|eukprot:CAMPEP_0117649622 /NCGR_PEP_ID=MMETSP0804-20121206/1076_1 /TAXON_ID=1074897 /ORGANISM="Tetraselmis astigmatica, Strain CCMP880" /LENGTH=224 /DNA_ID=CAMNT_0005455383 /DNA_START=55 /DNA_END=729 /DNA_ORIENTATION=-